MNPEIEKLTEMALADGQVTEKEREIILRKAEKIGLDVDEVEMYLEGKIYQLEADKSKLKEKVGNIKTCPACGASVKSFEIKCEDCGHEFNNVKRNNALDLFLKKLSSIDEEVRNEYLKNGQQYVNTFWGKKFEKDANLINYEIEPTIFKRKLELISMYEVPNAKEDILSFLAVASAEASKKISFTIVIGGNIGKNDIKNAWLSKTKNLIFKSRLLFKNDKSTLELIEEYARQLNI
jgi:hypothetical protein